MTSSKRALGLKNGSRSHFFSVGLAFCLVSALPAEAQDAGIDKQLKEISAQLKAQESRLAAQERELKAQQEAIAKQAAVIDAQRSQLARLREQPVQPQPAALTMEAPPPPAIQTAQANSGVTRRTPPPASTPTSPVGEAPKQDSRRKWCKACPKGWRCSPRPSHFILSPSMEYTHTTNDRLVFRGVVHRSGH